MKSQYATMNDEHPPLLHRSYSARTLDQQDPLPHPYHDHHNCYLQFEPDGTTRSVLRSSESFDESMLSTNSSNMDRSFGFNASFEQQRRELPPRVPGKYLSHHPGQSFHQHYSAPGHSQSFRLPPPERRNAKYTKRNPDGSFPREDDYNVYPKQELRRPSLADISPDPRGYTSMRSLLPSKKSVSKRSLGKQFEQKSFQPQGSRSIYRKFDKKVSPKQERDDDVWVERLILNGTNGVKRTIFKSLRGNITRKEPPTGASTIVYLEDIIVDKEGRPSMTKAKSRKKLAKNNKETKEQQPETASVSSQSQKQSEESIASDESQKDVQMESKPKKETKKKVPKGKLEGRACFFGFRKKKGKNKIAGDHAPEKE